MIQRRYLLSACLGSQLLAGGIALAEEPSKQQLLDKLDAMQAQMESQHTQMKAQQTQIDQLRSQLKQTQETTRTAVQEQADTIRKLANEANPHGRYFDLAGVNGGWDNEHGFYLQSDDGQSVWHPYVLFDAELSHSSRSRVPTSGMIEIGMDGSLFTKDLTYNFTLNYTQGNGTTVQYAWVQYVWRHDAMANLDLATRGGLFKDPAFKETGLIGDPNQLMVHTSLANALIGGVSTGPLVRSIEVIAAGDKSPMRAEFGIDDGPSRNQYLISGLVEPVPGAVFGTYARADYKFFGDWVDTHDMTGKTYGRNNLLDAGAGLDITATGKTGIYRGTLDVQYMAAHAWTVFAALYGDHYDAGGRNDWGGVVQGGYFLNHKTQLTARYSLVRADPAFSINNEDTYHELAVGMNYYLGRDGSWGNHAKFAVDFTYLPNGAPADSDLDYIKTTPGKRQFVLRGQFQFWL